MINKDVPEEFWSDWKWQIRNSITNYRKLEKYHIKLDEELENLNLSLRITPYYLNIAIKNPVLLKTCVSSINETIFSSEESEDPLGEEKSRKNNCIIHKYPDRVLFITTNFCSLNCRYCTRSRLLTRDMENIDKNDWDEGIQYIKNHKEVTDVLLSGGDILTMVDDKIEYLLKEISSIEHVEIIRLGTKVPVVLPMRITDDLVNMLKKYHPLYMSIHFTHPNEITEDVKLACKKLADAGIVLRSQTVLLKDINDNVDIMKKLMKKLLSIRVSPYYLYSCDRIPGSSHFYVELEKGREIIKQLRNNISGYGMPQFIFDSSNGKIPINPDYEK